MFNIENQMFDVKYSFFRPVGHMMHLYLNILHCVVLIVTFDKYTLISIIYFFQFEEI